MSGITLTTGQRNALLNLQDTDKLAQRTTLRLATGRAVNSVSDNAVNFFRSRSLANRASDFSDRKNDISQGVAAINSALEGTDAIDNLLKQLKGIVEGTRSASQTERKTATDQFFNVLQQVSQVIEDTSYQGLNLLNNTNNKLTIRFSERSNSFIAVKGFGLNSNLSTTSANSLFTKLAGSILYTEAGNVVTASNLRAIAFRALGYADKTNSATGFSNIGANSSNVEAVNGVITTIDAAIAKNRAISNELGNNASILQTRINFTTRYINRLQTGSDELILADLNEEGANLLSLQTRQQLGVNALSLSSQQQQAILQIVR